MILKKTILVTRSRRKSVFYESIGKMLSNCIELKSIICLVLKIDRSLKKMYHFHYFAPCLCVPTRTEEEESDRGWQAWTPEWGSQKSLEMSLKEVKRLGLQIKSFQLLLFLYSLHITVSLALTRKFNILLIYKD